MTVSWAFASLTYLKNSSEAACFFLLYVLLIAMVPSPIFTYICSPKEKYYVSEFK